MTRRSLVFLCVLAAVAPAVAHAKVIKVPQQFGSIGEAADNSLPGDEIVVAKGTYPGNVVISNHTNLTIRSKGKVTIVGEDSFGSALAANASFLLSSCTGVTVTGLRIKSPASFTGLVIATSDGCRIDRCRITGGAKGISGSSNGPVQVSRCTIGGASGNAISFAGDGATVTGCRITHCDGTGIDTTVDSADIERNVIRDVGGDGISIHVGSAIAVVANNQVTDAGGTGIVFAGPTAAGTIAGNRVSRASGGLIGLGVGLVIDDNAFAACGGTAIDGQGIAMVITRNRARKCGRGLELNSDSDGGIQSENVFTKSIIAGIELDAGSSANLLSRNTAKQSGQFDFIDHTGGANGLVDNRFGTVGP